MPAQYASRRAMADALSALLEENYAALARIAAFRGASAEQVEGVIREAAAAADPAAGRAPLVHELVVRVAALEQQAGRPVAVEPEADSEPAIADDHFEGPSSPWADFLVDLPPSLDELRPDGERAAQARAAAGEALADLPLGNRVVVVLRDVAGWSPDEVAGLLGVDLELQRVALHGARARVRRALERVAGKGDGDG
jgi:RNA polymerase sigma-70 factor (ECF subfamily)